MLKELLEDLEFVEKKMVRLDQTITQRVDLAPLTRLCTIPGIDILTAWTLLAELGSDMRVFPGPECRQLAGLCPGNNESAGKRLSNRTRKGNRWLWRALCQSAWARASSKGFASWASTLFYQPLLPTASPRQLFPWPPPRRRPPRLHAAKEAGPVNVQNA